MQTRRCTRDRRRGRICLIRPRTLTGPANRFDAVMNSLSTAQSGVHVAIHRTSRNFFHQ